MKQNQRNSTFIAIIITCLIFILYLLIDYFNIFSVLGIDISRINTDFLEIIANAVIAIIIFALGYYFVEQWNVKKLANQKAIAESLLLSIYKECLSSVELLDNPISAKSLFEQTDGNKKYNILDDLSPHMKYAQIPFMSESSLLEYFYQGILDKACFVTYQSIKHSFKSYVCVRVLLYDIPERYSSERASILNQLHQQISIYEHQTQKEV